MVRNWITRRAGGSETAKRSQPGNREAVLRGLRGQRPRSGLNLGATKWLLGNRGFPLFSSRNIDTMPKDSFYKLALELTLPSLYCLDVCNALLEYHLQYK